MFISPVKLGSYEGWLPFTALSGRSKNCSFWHLHIGFIFQLQRSLLGSYQASELWYWPDIQTGDDKCCAELVAATRLLLTQAATRQTPGWSLSQQKLQPQEGLFESKYHIPETKKLKLCSWGGQADTNSQQIPEFLIRKEYFPFFSFVLVLILNWIVILELLIRNNASVCAPLNWFLIMQLYLV